MTKRRLKFWIGKFPFVGHWFLSFLYLVLISDNPLSAEFILLFNFPLSSIWYSLVSVMSIISFKFGRHLYDNFMIFFFFFFWISNKDVYSKILPHAVYDPFMITFWSLLPVKWLYMLIFIYMLYKLFLYWICWYVG